MTFLEIGDYVEADECIARIETDKVTVDILAAHSGVITKWHTEVDETIEVDALLCDIDTEAKAGSAPPKAAAAPVAEAKKEAAPAKVSTRPD
jgi:2-oxoglutarate dehydrogenase E2 component (dihydrolipoamide succinyltransferase)